VRHIVLFRARAGGEDALTKLVARLPALSEQIGGVEDASAGPALPGEAAHGWTHALTIVFSDAAALDRYQSHPAHVGLVEELNPLVEDFLVFDVPVAQESIR
jgi:hypothetical protein